MLGYLYFRGTRSRYTSRAGASPRAKKLRFLFASAAGGGARRQIKETLSDKYAVFEIKYGIRRFLCAVTQSILRVD